MLGAAGLELQSGAVDEEVGAVHATADFTAVGAVAERLCSLSRVSLCSDEGLVEVLPWSVPFRPSV